MTPHKLLLTNHQSPGDIVMLTAALRDLHRAQPGRYQTAVKTAAPELWSNNPFVSTFDEGAPDVGRIDMHYPLIHDCNRRPYHFIHGFAQYLESELNVRIPLTEFRGDIYLSPLEASSPSPVAEYGYRGNYWIIVAGGKFDFTTKWWNPLFYQQVVDHFSDRIQFVQCGEAGHWHPPLRGVINLIGKTDIRQFIRAVYHAQGVLCPVTFAMHLAAAVPCRPGGPSQRPCVVIAGGREPPQWEAYPHHQFISVNGAMSCCMEGGCWRSRCQKVGDGDDKDLGNLCERPVQIAANLCIPECMQMISPADVIRRIELYYEGGSLKYHENGSAKAAKAVTKRPVSESQSAPRSSPVKISFPHGLGDCVHFLHLAQLLKRRGYDVHVHSDANKSFLWRVGGLKTCIRSEAIHYPWDYAPGFNRPVPESDSGSNKLAGNFGPPLPDIGPIALLWDELCNVNLEGIGDGLISSDTQRRVDQLVDGLPRPIVLLHTTGTNFPRQKNLPTPIIEDLYQRLLESMPGTLVLLDWDNRVPLLAHPRVQHLRSDWGSLALEALYALMQHSDLLIGVDSGPYHFASLTQTPALGIFLRHYPSCVTLPRARNVNLISNGENYREVNVARRKRWNIVEYAGELPTAVEITTQATRMLAGPRYLRDSIRMGRDVQLQQWISDWSQQSDNCAILDFALKEVSRRYAVPAIVHASQATAVEGWSDGYSSYIYGAFLDGLGTGYLIALLGEPVERDALMAQLSPWHNYTEVAATDAMSWLGASNARIDVLHLSPLDERKYIAAERAFAQLCAAEKNLHEASLVVIESTKWEEGWQGLGAIAVPYLLQRGWSICFTDGSVALSRQP
jgi:ADP-heptose:LPS heptosyltransferase